MIKYCTSNKKNSSVRHRINSNVIIRKWLDLVVEVIVVEIIVVEIVVVEIVVVKLLWLKLFAVILAQLECHQVQYLFRL